MKEELDIAERKAALLRNMKNMQKMHEQVESGVYGCERSEDQSKEEKRHEAFAPSSKNMWASSSLTDYAAKKKQRALRELAVILHQAWEGSAYEDPTERVVDFYLPGCLGSYQRFAEKRVQPFVQSPKFSSFIVAMILVAAVLVGLQTEDSLMCEDVGR